MTLDDIKRDIGHDGDCESFMTVQLGVPLSEWQGCNCTRRDKIALLERLQEPTRKMRIAMEFYDDDYAKFLKAAEEAQ